MEINEFKNAWAQYDRKLSQNIRLNEAMLRKVNLNAARRATTKPFQYELLSFLLFVIIIPVSIYWMFQYQDSWPLLFCSIALLSALLWGGVLCYKKLRLFYGLNYFDTDILTIQAQILLLKKTVLQYRKTELILLPVSFITAAALMIKQIHNLDFWDHTVILVPVMVTGFLVSLLGTLLTNKLVYDKRIRKAEYLLQEIKNYQSE